MILVTGGAGYIGSHTVVELLNNDYKVIIVDDFTNSKPEVIDKIKIITQKSPILEIVDIKDKEKLNYIFENYDIDGVIHFAALKAVSESIEKSLDYYENNISGLINVLQCCKKHNVNKFIFSSSCTVYGNPDEIMVDEQAPTKESTTPYGKSKKMGEDIIIDSTLSNNLKSILLRYFNPVGAHKSGQIGEDPNGTPNNLMPYIAQVAVGRRKCLNIYGNDYDTLDGTGARDYVHIFDLVAAHISALSKQEDFNKFEIINIGSGKTTTVLELLKSFENVSSILIDLKYLSRRSGDLAEFWADSSKASKLLSWNAKFSIDDICQDAWFWQKNNPDGYNIKD